ncbi:552_t:CDS:2, partial [Cetraspora pellucida]
EEEQYEIENNNFGLYSKQCFGKGRPATKHLKGFIKENSKAASNTKYANSDNEEKEIEVSAR